MSDMESVKPDEREGEQASEQQGEQAETQAASDSPASDASASDAPASVEPASDAPASTASASAEPASDAPASTEPTPSAVAEEASESPETSSISPALSASSTSEEVDAGGVAGGGGASPPAWKNEATASAPVPTGRILTADAPAPVEGALAEALSTLGVGEEEASASDGAEVGRKPQIDAKGRAYATGKRKDAVARVWLTPGSGNITVNGREFGAYFARPVLTMVVRRPLVLTERESQYDVVCTVRGGGLSGQAGAARHGISKALTFYEPELRPILKKAGALTRDARVVERKKYGRRKARRSFQFSKR